MALIVNADDLGMSGDVNRAICEAFDKELIDRTTMMTNMPGARAGMELARQNGFADKVGIHLNLTSGKPLTEEIAKDRVFCDENGCFTADFARSLKTRFFLPRKSAKNAEMEIRAQLDEYRAIGGTLWHIDSHHHVHTDPSIWRILKRAMRDYPVSSVRLGRNMYRGGNPLMKIYKVMLNASIKRHCRKGQDYFGSAEDYENYAKESPDLCKRYNVEVMVHPVYNDNGELSDVSGDNYRKLERLH